MKSTTRYLPIFCIFILSILFLNVFSQEKLTSPTEYFKFKPGTDRTLFDYEELISYLQKLETESPRIKLVNIGESPEGKPIYVAFISSEENIKNLDDLKAINKKLALDGSLSDEEVEGLVEKGRVFMREMP